MASQISGACRDPAARRKDLVRFTKDLGDELSLRCPARNRGQVIPSRLRSLSTAVAAVTGLCARRLPWGVPINRSDDVRLFNLKEKIPVTRPQNDATTRNIVLLSALLGLALAPEMAAANVLDNFANAILGILNSTFLRAVAIAAVIGAGLMALSGRVQWMTFIVVMLAVVIIFGSAGIVDYIRDNSATTALDLVPVFDHVV